MTDDDDDEIIFFCEECDKESRIPEVLCCGKPMKKRPLDKCTKATASAEHARFHDEDDACDEGRGGN